MLETVKSILDIVSQAIKILDFGKWKREKRLKDLGTELFLLYVNLNEVLVCATEIVDQLENLMFRIECRLESGEDKHALDENHWLSFKVQVQRINLARVGQSIQRFSNELQILDVNAYRKLVPFIRSKENVLNELLLTLAKGRLPLIGPTQADYDRLIKEFDMESDPSGHKMSHQLSWKLKEKCVDTGQSWGVGTYSLVREYFEDREPRKRLEDLELILLQLKNTLDQHFSLADVLVDIGDKRLSAENGYAH